MFVPMCSPAILLDCEHMCVDCVQLLWNLCLMTLRIARILFLSAWPYGAEEEDAALTLTCPPSRAICSLVRIIWYSDDMLVDSGGLVVYYAF